MSSPRAIGVVKFWNLDKGWGAIGSEALPSGRDAWVLWSRVEFDRHRMVKLEAGQVVEFSFHAQKYESFDFVADFVRVVPEPKK